MQLITADAIHQSCSFPELIDALEQAHLEAPAILKDILLSSSRDDKEPPDTLLVRAAWLEGSALGVKAAAVFPRNSTQENLPAIHAAFVMYDGSNGIPVAVVDGTVMTYYKTAADSALASRYLAPKNTTTMAMIGAGAMAPYLIEAHCYVRKTIQKVVIWNRTASRAEDLASRLSIPNVEVTTAPSIESAVADADLVCSATMTRDPIIHGVWLKPGTHVDLIGAYTIEMREVDDEAIRRSRIFVDSRRTTIGEIGEIDIPLKNGTISEADILADLYQLCSKSVPGRTSEDEITLFKNGGGGHLDLMTARHIVSAIECE